MKGYTDRKLQTLKDKLKELERKVTTRKSSIRPESSIVPARKLSIVLEQTALPESSIAVPKPPTEFPEPQHFEQQPLHDDEEIKDMIRDEFHILSQSIFSDILDQISRLKSKVLYKKSKSQFDREE